MPNVMILKWGTAKGWDIETEEAKEALRKWAEFGTCMSSIVHKDKPGQQQALLDAMDYFDEFWLDWDGKQVTREEAKKYILEYGKNNAGNQH